MTTRLFSILAALSGILGVIMIITSFAINSAPLPPNPTVAELAAFASQQRNFVLAGSWLQAVGPALIALFALAVVHLAGLTSRFVGQATLFGATILMLVSLVEVTFYIGAINGNPATTALMSLNIIRAVQHLYSIVAAPLLFLPLAVVILSSRVLPHILGYIALALGIAFAILGPIVLFSPLQYLVDILSYIQGVWWLATAITLLLRAPKMKLITPLP
jgi:hypothetical protein